MRVIDLGCGPGFCARAVAPKSMAVEAVDVSCASMSSGWARAVAKVVPTGTPVPFLRGPLRGKWWIAGAGSSPGKGLRIPLNQIEPEQLACASSLAHGLAFDVGANLGLYSLLFSQECSHVYAFEPSVRCISYLWRHLKLNRVHNVTVVPVGVSDRIGLSSFDPNRFSVGSYGDFWGQNEMWKSNAPEPLSNARAPIMTITLDDFVDEYKVTPSIIKIDVEGAEMSVLEGARRLLAMRPILLLSVHTDDLREECLTFLAELKYKITGLDQSRLSEAFQFVAQ